MRSEGGSVTALPTREANASDTTNARAPTDISKPPKALEGGRSAKLRPTNKVFTLVTIVAIRSAALGLRW